MKRIFPRDYFNEMLVSSLLGVLGILSIIWSSRHDSEIILTIGGGVFTGTVLHLLTFTAYSIKNRRENMERLFILAINFNGRFKWIFGPKSITKANLNEFLVMLDETKDLDEIYGRIWFLDKTTRERVYELYSLIKNVTSIVPTLMQYEMTAENTIVVSNNQHNSVNLNDFDTFSKQLTKREFLMILAIQKHLEVIFDNYGGLPSKQIDIGTEYMEKLINKSWF